jgi:hypothetical protein
MALGHNPVLDTDILAGVRIRPTRDIAGCKQCARGRLSACGPRDRSQHTPISSSSWTDYANAERSHFMSQ